MASDTPLLGGSPLSTVTAVLPKSFSSCVLAEGANAARAKEYKATQRKLIVALVFAFTFMIVEVVGGIYAHSLAIITDAAHLLSDVSGFAVSALAAVYAAKRSHEHFSYGYHRIEVLGALASILTVWLVTGVLVFEAINRIITPEPVNGKIMFILAMTGVGVNLLLVWILGGHHHHHGHSHDHDHSHGHEHHRSGSGCNGVSRPPQLDTVPESPLREKRAAADAGRGDSCGGHSSHGHGEGDVEAGHGGHHHGHAHSDHGEEGHCHSSDEEQGQGEGEGHSHHSHGSGCGGNHSHGHSHGHNHSHGHDHNHSAAGSHDRRNINLRGAVVHVIGDLVQSIGVAVAGALIWYHQDDPRWYIADPICTFLFAILVMWTTRAILRDIADVLMERVPRGLCIKTINQELGRLPGVEEVHDLHVWSLTPGIPLLCAHINMSVEADPSEVLHAITTYCRGVGIEHSTVQLVVNGRACPCACVPASLE